MTSLSVTRVSGVGAAVRALPAAGIVALGLAAAWRERGSVASGNWLSYAILAALLLAVVAASGAAAAVPRRVAYAAAALLGLAAWDALSLRWSASPALARDEALLTALYAVALLVPVVSLRGGADRVIASGALVAGLGGIALATALELVEASSVDSVYRFGRLNFPISYPNAQAAFFLVGVWPALSLAARRELPAIARGLSVAAAAAFAGGWALAQSKGGALGLALSTIVVFAVAQQRLRLVLPGAIVAATVGAAFVPLTAPYGDRGLYAVHRAGAAELAVAAAAFVLGLAYAALDNRVRLDERLTGVLGRAVLLGLVAVVATGTTVFYATVREPADFFAAQWESFKRLPAHDVATTHFVALGSNRYDFWRVALQETKAHPLAGIGSRGFRAAYLLQRRSPETPARSHSLELDALSETGIVGLALLAAALGCAIAAFAWRARDDLIALGALGAATCWLTHASVDWTWTFPAVGLPLFALLGIGAAGTGRPLRKGTGALIAAGAVALAVGAFGLPWLSTRYVNDALAGRGDSVSELRRAASLDPVSVDPLLARWALAPTPRAGVQPLLEAVRKEPRSPDLLYALGRQQLLAGDKAAGRRTLQRALALAPGDPGILAALRAAH